jgi:hypothetical protein
MPQGLCPKPLPLEFPEYKSSEVRRWEFYFKKKQIIEKNTNTVSCLLSEKITLV